MLLMVYVQECSMFSFRIFMVSCLVFKFLSHFLFIFVYDVTAMAGGEGNNRG